MAGRPYEVRRRRGREFRKCAGPLHRQGKWIPVSEFGIRAKSKRLRSHCRACEHVHRYKKPPRDGLVGYVQMKKFRFAVMELERRLGKVEACRRVGVGWTTWQRWSSPTCLKIQKRTAAKLIQTLAEVRAKGEVRHANSIRRGASRRGEIELVPVEWKDFYIQAYDSHTESRRKWRENNPEKEQAQYVRAKAKRQAKSAAEKALKSEAKKKAA